MKKQEIQVDDIWNDKKKDELKKFISIHSAQQSKERKSTNELLSTQYKLEDSIQNENDEKICNVN